MFLICTIAMKRCELSRVPGRAGEKRMIYTLVVGSRRARPGTVRVPMLAGSGVATGPDIEN